MVEDVEVFKDVGNAGVVSDLEIFDVPFEVSRVSLLDLEVDGNCC